MPSPTGRPCPLCGCRIARSGVRALDDHFRLCPSTRPRQSVETDARRHA